MGGDAFFKRRTNGNLLFAVIAGSGHGRGANRIAAIAEEFLANQAPVAWIRLDKLMRDLHECLQGTRGAAVALARLDCESGDLHCRIVGNVNARVAGSKNATLLSRNGTVGRALPPLPDQCVSLMTGDMVLLYTDGVRRCVSLDEKVDRPAEKVQDLATLIVGEYGKKRDDALCAVLRYGR